VTKASHHPASASQTTGLQENRFAFFFIELRSRKVIHVGVTRSPTDAWTAQQLREATAYGQTPRYLIRDNDSKLGHGFARVAAQMSQVASTILLPRKSERSTCLPVRSDSSFSCDPLPETVQLLGWF